MSRVGEREPEIRAAAPDVFTSPAPALTRASGRLASAAERAARRFGGPLGPLVGAAVDHLRSAILRRTLPADVDSDWARYAESLPGDPTQAPIQLAWGAPWPNFGDALSPLVVHALSGRNLRGKSFARDLPGPKLLALGSILDRARDGDVVWGAGHRGFPLAATKLDVRAVRGPLTRDALLARGIDCPEVYGDPAQLLPRLFPRPHRFAASPRIGIVAHFSDHGPLRHLDGDDLVRIGATLPAMAAIDAIASCTTVLSSSLHGLIVAEAYGIPALWMRPGPRFWRWDEPELKFHDYFAATRRAPHVYRFDAAADLDLDAAVALAAAAPRPLFDDRALLASFPFHATSPL